MRLSMPNAPSRRRHPRWLDWGTLALVAAAFFAVSGSSQAADPPPPANPRGEIANALQADQPSARRLAAVLLLGVLAEKRAEAGPFANLEPNLFTDQVVKMAKDDPDAAVRIAALNTMGRLQPRLNAVVPVLSAVLNIKEKGRTAEREAAVLTMGALATQAIPYEIVAGAATLVSADDNKVVVKIGEIERSFKVDPDTWITFHYEKESRARTDDISLTELGKMKDTPIWLSAKGENEPLTAVRIQAISTLSPDKLSPDNSLERPEKLAGTGAQLIPLLAQALSDRDPLIRRSAAAGTLQFATAARELASVVRQGSLKERQNVRRALAPLLKAFREHSPALAAVMTLPDNPPEGAKSARLLACQTLEELAGLRESLPKPSDEELPRDPGLQEQEENDALSASAQNDKSAVGPLGDLTEILRALEEVLTNRNDPEVDARIAVVQALELVGVDALPATPALVKALSDPNPFLRWTAARTLGTVEAARRRAKLPTVKGAEGAVDGLIALIYNPDSNARVNLDTDAQIAAIVALAAFDKDAEKAVEVLGTVAAEDAFNARFAALSTLKALWNQGVKKRAPSALLARALAQTYPEHPQVQIAAAELLGLYGPAAADAVPALRAALKDPEIGVRRAASEALLKITR
jgi:HEAT repeat protein